MVSCNMSQQPTQWNVQHRSTGSTPYTAFWGHSFPMDDPQKRRRRTFARGPTAGFAVGGVDEENWIIYRRRKWDHIDCNYEQLAVHVFNMNIGDPTHSFSCSKSCRKFLQDCPQNNYKSWSKTPKWMQTKTSKHTKATRWSPRTRIPTRTYVEEQRHYLFVTFYSEPTCGTPWLDTLKWHSCRTPCLKLLKLLKLLRNALVRRSIWHSCGTLLLDTLVRHSYLTILTWHSCTTPLQYLILFLDTSYLTLLQDYLTLLQDTLAWHSSGTLLLDTLVRHPYLTLL